MTVAYWVWQEMVIVSAQARMGSVSCLGQIKQSPKGHHRQGTGPITSFHSAVMKHLQRLRTETFVRRLFSTSSVTWCVQCLIRQESRSTRECQNWDKPTWRSRDTLTHRESSCRFHLTLFSCLLFYVSVFLFFPIIFPFFSPTHSILLWSFFKKSFLLFGTYSKNHFGLPGSIAFSVTF